MVWTKVSDNRWERPIDGLESFLVDSANLSAQFFNGRQHFNPFSRVTVDIDIPNVEAALKQTWKQVRYDQPQIATTVEGRKKVYEVPDEKALKEWLSSTFIVSPEVNAQTLYPTLPPIKQATLYYFPQSSEIAFRAHHYTIDGIGILMFWDRFFKTLASPAENIIFGDETARLAPIMEETLGFRETPTHEQTKKATYFMDQYADSIPGVGPINQIGMVPAGKCQIVELSFPATTTEALVRACKDKKLSVTSAVHAAYISAIAQHADPTTNQGIYASNGQFNLRSYLPTPYNSSQYAVSVYYGILGFFMDLPASFTDSAKRLHEFYQSFKEHPDMLELNGHTMRVMAATFSSPEFLTKPPPKDAPLSSLGITENYMHHDYGGIINVKDFGFGLEVVLGLSQIFVFTFRGQLRLSYAFNDSYQTCEAIQTILSEIKTILNRELLA